MSARIILIGSEKGGVGKTMLTRLLTEGLLRLAGEPQILAIDLDPQCSLSLRWLAMETDEVNEDGFYPPIHNQAVVDDVGDPTWDGRSSSADIFLGRQVVPYEILGGQAELLPAHAGHLSQIATYIARAQPDDNRGSMQGIEDIERRIHSTLREFLRREDVLEAYDFILMDTSPTRSPLLVSAMRAATDVIIPFVPETQSVEGVSKLLKLWRMENDRRAEDDRLNLVGLAPNMVRNVALHRQTIENMRVTPGLEELICPVAIRSLVAFAESDHRDTRPQQVYDRPASDSARKDAEAFVTATLLSIERAKVHSHR